MCVCICLYLQEDLEGQFVGEEDDGSQISLMVLPDTDGKSREKDIQVNNVNVTFGGHVLLEGADIRLVYGRRYGLIGRNGIGKTTLLKQMASFAIDGFPRHHRVLHVKQEVLSSLVSVLDTVLSSDVERNQLLQREAACLAAQERGEDAEAALSGERAPLFLYVGNCMFLLVCVYM